MRRRCDTDAVARGTGTYGSKSVQIGGLAASQASDQVVERGKELAAEELEASVEDMVLDLGSGRFHVAGAPQPGLTWTELAQRLAQRDRLSELRAETDLERFLPWNLSTEQRWAWGCEEEAPAPDSS